MMIISLKSLAQGKESLIRWHFKVVPFFISVGFNDLTDSQSLVGYIQITGPKFYSLCPSMDVRENWFAQFKEMKDYKVRT